MPVLIHGSDGLLPPGEHHCTLADVRSVFVDGVPGDGELRSAVFAALVAWLTMARRVLGAGTCGIGGGFVSIGEPTDTAMAVYFPDDNVLAEVAAQSGAAVDLVSLKGVVYSYPGGGGGVRERWPVSGLLDTHIADRKYAQAFRNGLARVLDPNGMAVPGVVKGYVEVEVR